MKTELVENKSQIKTKASFCSQRGKSNDWWLKMFTFTTLLFNTFIHLIKKIHWALAVVLLNKTANWFDFILNILLIEYCRRNFTALSSQQILILNG